MEKIRVLFDETDEKEITKAIEKDGFSVLWNGSQPFGISASACITLTQLRSRWPSMTENFISEYMVEDNILPLAGIETHFADSDMYRCIPKKCLAVHEEDSGSTTQSANPYQRFKGGYEIIDFVLPLYEVECFEQHSPELLLRVVNGLDDLEKSASPALFREVLARIASVEEDELITNHNHYLAAILYASGMIARTSHMLITGKPNVEENGRQGTAREWRNKGLKKLGFDLDDLKSKKII